MQKKWVLRKSEPVIAAAMAGDLGIHPLIAAILSARGIGDSTDARLFLSPSLADMIDPSLMKGAAAAVERLQIARQQSEIVCIYGDFDVDGITGTALLVSFLRKAGFDCRYFIPNRFDDGYGLNNDAIERIREQGATLIVTVDCGITAIDEALFCRERGVDLIIVDHHTPGKSIPDAVAVLNPLQPGCAYPYKALAGVGVAFNLLVALRAALRNEGVFLSGNGPDLREWLDLVALGSIADIVPLTGQNRIYAWYGLRLLSNSVKPGIQALKQVAGLSGEVNCGHVGFRLAPRLNAAGRMESAVPGVELLLCPDPIESQRVALELDTANAERQTIERSIFAEAVALVDSQGGLPGRRSIVLASESWHQGVIGIVASRLVERYHRPTILIALAEDGTAKGSGRSIPGFHLLEAISGCAGLLERFGGHRYAAGIGLASERVAEFAVAFEAEALRILGDVDPVPRLEIDVEVRPEDVTRELALELKQMEPFGAGNPEPLFVLRGLTVTERRVVGEGHLRLRLSGGNCLLSAIAFRMVERETSGLIDIAFFPEMNEWNGSSSLQLRIKDLRPSE